MRLALLTCLLLTGCPSPPDAPPPQEAPAPVPVAPALPAPAPPTEASLSGSIIETMDAAGYTYLQIQTPEGPRWAAVQQARVSVGDPVVLTQVSWMQDFYSRSLDRTFDQIAFARLGSAPGATPRLPEVTPGTAAAGHSGAPPVQLDTAIGRAEGPDAHTIAEVYADKAGLSGKKVAVRGKVVKVTPAVMDRTWIHIQDGSGSPARKDHDLTITTQDQVAVGEVVTAWGTLTTDKDLGGGYRFDALVEDASLTR